MKIVVENHIPYIQGYLEPFADTVVYLPADAITSESVTDADVLLVRTRTRCDAALLSGSRCRFIGTATIGTDHIDLEYCRDNGITVVNAPGCNAPAVAQYVHSTIAHWLAKNHLSSTACHDLTLGIVGVGHVGSIVERWARELGYNVLLCDPPRAHREGASQFVGIDTIAEEADIITFHTPLTSTGEFATRHLCDASFINSMVHCRLLINSARGAIADNAALLRAIDDGKIADVAIDCWENEPHINLDLLKASFIATPHIAGYSAEGKLRATSMLLDALGKHFGWGIDSPQPATPRLGASHVTLEHISQSYNPLSDTAKLKALAATSPDTFAQGFESLRNDYHLRPEVAETDNNQQ